MTIEEFKAKAKEVIDKEQFGSLGVLFDYESFEEMKVAQIPDSLDSATSDMPLDDFLDKLYEQIKQDSILDNIRAEIESMRIVYDKSPNYEDDRTDEEKAVDWFNMDKLLFLQIIDKYKAGE